MKHISSILKAATFVHPCSLSALLALREQLSQVAEQAYGAPLPSVHTSTPIVPATDCAEGGSGSTGRGTWGGGLDNSGSGAFSGIMNGNNNAEEVQLRQQGQQFSPGPLVPGCIEEFRNSGDGPDGRLPSAASRHRRTGGAAFLGMSRDSTPGSVPLLSEGARFQADEFCQSNELLHLDVPLRHTRLGQLNQKESERRPEGACGGRQNGLFGGGTALLRHENAFEVPKDTGIPPFPDSTTAEAKQLHPSFLRGIDGGAGGEVMPASPSNASDASGFDVVTPPTFSRRQQVRGWQQQRQQQLRQQAPYRPALHRAAEPEVLGEEHPPSSKRQRQRPPVQGVPRERKHA